MASRSRQRLVLALSTFTALGMLTACRTKKADDVPPPNPLPPATSADAGTVPVGSGSNSPNTLTTIATTINIDNQR